MCVCLCGVHYWRRDWHDVGCAWLLIAARNLSSSPVWQAMGGDDRTAHVQTQPTKTSVRGRGTECTRASFVTSFTRFFSHFRKYIFYMSCPNWTLKSLNQIIQIKISTAWYCYTKESNYSRGKYWPWMNKVLIAIEWSELTFYKYSL